MDTYLKSIREDSSDSWQIFLSGAWFTRFEETCERGDAENKREPGFREVEIAPPPFGADAAPEEYFIVG
jgi:hypothetical protein